MGVKQSRGTAQLSADELARIFVLPDGVWMIASQRYAPDALTGFRFLGRSMRDAARRELDRGVPAEGDRAIGCLLGLAVGDALGAPLEFHRVRYPDSGDLADEPASPSGGGSGELRAGFDQPQLWEDTTDLRETNRFLLRMGQWTDDTAMALCLADSLLQHGGLHPRDLRLRFLAWWMLGYNNAFRLDQAHRDEVWGSAGSIGLGGIIGDSLQEFTKVPADYTGKGSLRSSGNGSIMRNAPVPIMYRNDIDMAMEAAWRQSKTTHQGEEAADCARLLTWICVRAITSGAGKAVLDDLEAFPAKLYSTRCLAAARQEARHAENEGQDLSERDWRWRRGDFRYAAARAEADPGYAGSYCMDCMAMALHCVHATSSFQAAVLRAADTCGDADTVAAVAGQLAGAMYGAAAVPEAWSSAVERWDEGDLRCRAWLLFAREAPPAHPSAHEQADGGSWTGLEVGEVEEEGADFDPEVAAAAAAAAAACPKPFACSCGRTFASQQIFKAHQRKCESAG